VKTIDLKSKKHTSTIGAEGYQVTVIASLSISILNNSNRKKAIGI